MSYSLGEAKGLTLRSVVVPLIIGTILSRLFQGRWWWEKKVAR